MSEDFPETISETPETIAETQVRAELDELDADAPRVGILMGSKSDLETMQKAADELTARDILHEVRVMSAHRDPEQVAEYAKNARMRGLRVLICGAGLSAALPGVVAAHTDLPGDRRAADQPDLRGRRARRDPGDRPDAAGRSGGLRGRRQPAQRGRAGRADPVDLGRASLVSSGVIEITPGRDPVRGSRVGGRRECRPCPPPAVPTTAPASSP